MKLCDYCETNLPDDAIHCAECGMVLPGAADHTSNGFPIPNPITPIPDTAIMETVPVLHGESPLDMLPTIPEPEAIFSPDADAITDNPQLTPHHSTPSALDLISDDALTLDTDPNLAEIPSLAPADDLDDDPAPANGHLAEQSEDADTLSVMSFAEIAEESAVSYDYAHPAPLYPDYGKAESAVPAPLYADAEIAGKEGSEDLEDGEDIPTAPEPLYVDDKAASQKVLASTNALMFIPRKISTAYPRLLSARGLIAVLLCLALVLSSVGLYFYKNHQSPQTKPVITPIAAKLKVITRSLSSEVVKGFKVVLPVSIANEGRKTLHWTADSSNTSWLSLGKYNDIILSGAPPQEIFVTADAHTLTVGNHTSTIHIHSNGGNQNIQVSLNVIPFNGKKQPILSVNPNPPGLNFGSVQQGQQETGTIYIGNVGTSALHWNASTITPWVTPGPTSGTILPGGDPVPLTITVNTANPLVQLGFNDAVVKITSDDGKAPTSVGISLTMIGSNGNSLTISANPGSFTNGCLSCTVILSASKAAPGSQASVHWSTTGIGISGITFNPSSGTLLANQSIPVTVTVPNTSCPASANFTFVGAANNVSVLWSCTPPPTPVAILTASPNSFTDGCTTCIVTLSPAAGSQSNLVWNSSSRGIGGITFNPQQGTISPGNMQQVTVNVPQTCPATASFTFSGQGSNNYQTISWSCTKPPPQAPMIAVNPNTLDQSSSNCSSNPDGTYNCTVTLSESPAGNLSWSSYSNVGGNFSQSTGQFSSGQTQTTITISNILCQSGSFGFNGPNNSASVQWTCNPPQTPTLSVNPQSLNQNSSACSSDGNGGYNCNVTLRENPQGTLNWQESDNLSVSVSQSNGTLTAGNSSIQISLFNIPCSSQSTNDTFTFSTTNSNTVTVNWSCTAPPTPTTPPTLPPSPTTAPPPNINVSPNTIDPTTCTNNNDGTYSCSVSVNENSSGNVSWNASDSLGMATFSPTNNGQLSTSAPGQNVTITLPCMNDTVYFVGTNSNTVQMGWVCSLPPSPTPSPTPPPIGVNPSSIDPTTCTNNNDGTYSCNVSVNENSSGNVSWNASDSLGMATFSPSNNGQLSTSAPSQNVTITLPCMNDTVYFVGTNSNTVQMGWVCSLPPSPTPPPPPSPTPTSVPAMLSFSPMSFPNASGCSYTAGSGWTCIETLSVNADATQNLTWNVSASSPDITFSSYGGTMSAGQTSQITITIPDRFCPVNEFFLFAATNQGNGVYVNWNCNAVLADLWQGCRTFDNGVTYLCDINLYLATGSQGKMSWNMSTASGSAKIIPYSSGTLTPSSSDLITVQTGCYDTITIVGQGGSSGSGNTITIPWACK